MPKIEIEVDEELYKKIEAWLLTNNIDMTVDECATELIKSMFKEKDEFEETSFRRK